MGKREQNRERKRQSILDAALIEFATQGVGSARMADVAQRAGVGKGTLYEYYDSKDDLFFAVFERYADSVFQFAQNAASQTAGDAAQQLKHLVLATVEEGKKGLEHFGISLEFWSASGGTQQRDRLRNALLEMYEIFRNAIRHIICTGKSGGVFRAEVDEVAVAAGLVGTLDGIMLQGWMDSDFDISVTVEAFIEPLLRGMLV